MLCIVHMLLHTHALFRCQHQALNDVQLYATYCLFTAPAHVITFTDSTRRAGVYTLCFNKYLGRSYFFNVFIAYCTIKILSCNYVFSDKYTREIPDLYTTLCNGVVIAVMGFKLKVFELLWITHAKTNTNKIFVHRAGFHTCLSSL